MRGWALASLISLTLAAPFILDGAAGAEVVGNRYQSKAWGLRITAPANWYLSQQTSYPDILLWMYRPNPPGKMLLSAEELDDGLTSRQYAERTADTLTKLKASKFQVGTPQLHAATGAYWIDFDDGKTFLRQALLVSGNVGYSLTLSATGEKLRQQHVRAFDYALRRIRLDRKRTPGADSDSLSPGTLKPESSDIDGAKTPAGA